MSKPEIARTNPNPVQLPRRKIPAFTEWAIPVCVVFSATLLLLALPNIISGHDLWSTIKAFIMSLSAGIVAYAVNRVAIELGAPQAARGYVGASIVSLLAILSVGFGLFAATYAGLVFKDVEAIRLQQHGAAVSVFAGDRAESAAEAARAVPALKSIVDDLSAKRDCELANSCVSGRGEGGRGPVWRALDALAGRAEAIQTQLVAGESARGAALEALDGAIAEFQRILADESRDIWTRRTDLQTLDVRVRQQAALLAEATPLALIAAYANELKANIVIADRADATAALAAITQKHAAALETVIATIEGAVSLPPPFPARAGVADTLAFIGHFIPVAAIAAVVEVIFPSALWLFTYWGLRWGIFQEEAARAASIPAPRSKKSGADPASDGVAPKLITHAAPPARTDGSASEARVPPMRRRGPGRRPIARS